MFLFQTAPRHRNVLFQKTKAESSKAQTAGGSKEASPEGMPSVPSIASFSFAKRPEVSLRKISEIQKTTDLPSKKIQNWFGFGFSAAFWLCITTKQI